MRRRAAVSAERLGALLVFFSQGVLGCLSTRSSDLARSSIAFGNLRIVRQDRSVHVISGTGQTLFKVPNGYYHSDMHPDQRKIVCIRKRRGLCELVEVELDKKKKFPVRVLFTAAKNEFFASPVWSPSGDRVACLVGDGVVILDPKGKVILRKIPCQDCLYLVRDPEINSPPFSYIRWGTDGARVFIRALRETEKRTAGLEVGEMESGTGKVRWIGPMVGSHYMGPTGDKLEDSEAVRAIFGSGENPVIYPFFAKDRRYYFYYNKKEGFMAKGWIERYDRITKKKEVIKVLWRRFYQS